MKKVLGLDLGTTSIGWAFVHEAENENEKSEIVKLGVRVVPLTAEEEGDFLKGKTITTNADRTLKRGARRNLDRYQLRRKKLVQVLTQCGIIKEGVTLSEEGKCTTFETLELRARAATEKIDLGEFAKALLHINKKRGYKSSRKVQADDEGVAVDGMEAAKYLHEKKITPGEYVYDLLIKDKKHTPDFYRSDLQNEFDRIWGFQKEFYPEEFTDALKDNLLGKNKKQTWAICKTPFALVGMKQSGTAREKKIEKFSWRKRALIEKLDLEKVADVLSEINNSINSSSGYLGAISDRSKTLFFNKQTIGQFLFQQIKANPHTRLKNQVFYRQDYLDEFETLWEQQKQYHEQLTDDLKREIRDEIIFYQRRLKSQKHLISNCEFEKNHKAVPKSSPLFQEFKVWQILNNIEYRNTESREKSFLEQEQKELLYQTLNKRAKLSAKDALKLLFGKAKNYELNYKDIEGNRTNAALYGAYQQILALEGIERDFNKIGIDEVNRVVYDTFQKKGIDLGVLSLDINLEKDAFDKQPQMQLWHLLYSFEGDNTRTGNGNLLQKLQDRYGFAREHAKLVASVKLQDDHGSLSSRAIRKIMPYITQGNTYSEACALAGYNHSSSKTAEELATRKLKEHLELLPKNSLRNPIVEKILNQTVNVVNAIIDDPNLGKPDEIRVELARELKNTADERERMSREINTATARHEKIREILKNEFKISKVTRNDIIRYKLWEELEANSYKTLYTNTYIQREKIFSKDFDIEHIIPKAKLFDDSFSNKTLAVKSINLEKSDETAFDFLEQKLNNAEFDQYQKRIEGLYKRNAISKAKYNKLKMKSSEIPDGFIERDLRNSQYIAKKAKQMLEDVARTVNTTTGKITDRLRSDWQLVNVMKELNLPKYESLGLVNLIEGKNGQTEKQIRDWTKRNDHRHHAMDALTVAFTSYSHVQYLNNLSARKNEKHKEHKSIHAIEAKYLSRNEKGKLLFHPPMPIHQFREEAKKHIESILISFKAKNKVVTRNKNKVKVKGKGNFKTKIELTPRGQLHKETVYGRIKQPESKWEKIGTKFDQEKIQLVTKPLFRQALLSRLEEFGGNPKKAFGGKNAPSKSPIYLDSSHTEKLPEKVQLLWLNDNYTIRKPISHDLKIEKVIDKGIQKILWERLAEYGGKAKEAFTNLDENPIWLNKNKTIAIKRVTISGVSNAEALHSKKDKNGQLVLGNNGEEQAVDFVSTGNNHHVAIYRDNNGKLQEEVVSLFEAVHRVNDNQPIINKNKEGLEFLFTLKQNEYFVFPSDNFDPSEIDLLNPDNAAMISPSLFRVQKIGSKDYWFRHHLETILNDSKETKNITWKRITNISFLETVLKVRVNHLGQIVKVGEY